MPAGLNWLNRLRLASGLVMLAFLLTHLGNHALGLISLPAMETGRLVFLAVWRNWPMTIVFYGSLALHLSLTIWSLLRRRTWRGVRRGELAQAAFGLAVPPLLAGHIAATRGLHEVFGLNDSYAYMLLALWVSDPLAGLQQAAVVALAWGHGCMGLYYWSRLKSWYAAAAPWLYAAALVVPLLGLLGFAAGGREAARLVQDPAWAEAYRASLNVPSTAAMRAWAHGLRDGAQYGMAALLAVLVLGRIAFVLLPGRATVTLTYPGGREARFRPASLSVLEASRQFGIPHAAVCGGRGRCSTCRVRLGAGAPRLPPPSADEARVLARVAAGPDVRLACQIRPNADLTVTPLLPPDAPPSAAFARATERGGVERELAVLFADLRGFTAFADGRLPFDVVFMLNRYFLGMGDAVTGAGGRVDKFIGDGVMALFGLETDLPTACRQAVAAAGAMSRAMRQLNAELGATAGRPLRLGIGLHCGPCIVGEIGYGPAMQLTAIGDIVNTASRLESATKDHGVELVLSQAVARHAGIDPASLRRETIALRGLSEPLGVCLIGAAGELAAR
jgi:adenylate cyclase